MARKSIRHLMLEGQCHVIAEDCATYYTMAAASKKSFRWQGLCENNI